LFEFAEEATLGPAAPAAPAAPRAEASVAAEPPPRDTKGARNRVDDAGEAVAADQDRPDEAQGKSNLEEILGGDLPLGAIGSPQSTDEFAPEASTDPFEKIDAAIASAALESARRTAEVEGSGASAQAERLTTSAPLEAATASPPVDEWASDDRTDPPLQKAVETGAVTESHPEPASSPRPELRLSLEDTAIAAP